MPYRHRRTPADVVEDDRDLLGAVVNRLAPISARVLRPTLELASGKRIEGEVRTQGLRRLRILVDREEREYRSSLEDGAHPIKLPVTGAGPHEVELRGEGPGGDVLARRRVTLGGL